MSMSLPAFKCHKCENTNPMPWERSKSETGEDECFICPPSPQDAQPTAQELMDMEAAMSEVMREGI